MLDDPAAAAADYIQLHAKFIKASSAMASSLLATLRAIERNHFLSLARAVQKESGYRHRLLRLLAELKRNARDFREFYGEDISEAEVDACVKEIDDG